MNEKKKTTKQKQKQKTRGDNLGLKTSLKRGVITVAILRDCPLDRRDLYLNVSKSSEKH